MQKGGPFAHRWVTRQLLTYTVVIAAVLAAFMVLWLFAVPGDRDVRSVATPPNESTQGRR